MTERKSDRSHQRRRVKVREGTLNSPEGLLCRGAPNFQELVYAVNVIQRAAAGAELSAAYTERVTEAAMDHAQRLDLWRASIVLVFKNSSPHLIWDAVEYILVPLLTGLCEGRNETGNIIGIGMIGSDGREHLGDLDRDEGEPLSRIIEAIARLCPETLFTESDND